MNNQSKNKSITSEAVAELWVKLLFAHIEAKKFEALKTKGQKQSIAKEMGGGEQSE